MSTELYGAGDDAETLSQVVTAVKQLRDVILEMRKQIAGASKSHYSVEELASMTARSPYTIRRWISQGHVRAERVSGTGPRGRLLIPRDEIQKLIGSGQGARIPDALARSQT